MEGLLFVCTANIARSPYSARRLAHLAQGSAFTAGSAGIPGVRGREMDLTMAAELDLRGGDSSGHVSRCLTDELVEVANLILTFEFAQHMLVIERWPEAASKAFGLHQFADAVDRVDATLSGIALVDEAARVCAPDSMTWDVRDPYRRGRRAARRCADEIDEALVRIVPALGSSRQPV